MSHKLRFVLAFAGVALFGGCSSGSSSNDDTATVSVAMTDAASDQIDSFTVDVTGIQLVRPSGAPVNVVSSKFNVDLTALSDLSQILNIANVPAGLYSSANITLDFTNASCVLAGKTDAATIEDASGAPINGAITLPIQFGEAGLTINASRLSMLEFDFDLNQSVIVDTTNNIVTMEPTFVVRLDRTDPKPIIIVGKLLGVDAQHGVFAVDMTTLSGQSIAQIACNVNAETTYQIDGVPSVGDAGITALAGEPMNTWIQLYGAINLGHESIEVAYVEAGAGTYNGGSDIVEGHIIGRTGGAGANATVTVRGNSNNASHDQFLFNTDFTVSTSFASTKVLRRGRGLAYDTDSLNIGQLVRVFGTLSGTTMDATSANSVVRLQPTRVLGFANGSPSAGVLTMSLVRVDLRNADVFNWDESGPTPPDPKSFTVNVGSLGDGLGIGTETAVEARGFFPTVQDANQDFVANALTNRDLAPSLVIVFDEDGGFTTTTTTSDTEIDMSISGDPAPGEVAVVDKGFVGTLPLPPTSKVVPADGFVLYSICDHATGSIGIYLKFSDFSAALGNLLNSGRQLVLFAAIGDYEDTTSTTTAALAKVVVR
jgi:hypothetical protein